MALAREFGIGPSSLTKITATKPESKQDPVDAYRARRRSA